MNTPNRRACAADEKKPSFESRLSDDQNNPPDGGLTAWLTVLGVQVFLIQFCGFGFVNAFGVFQAYYSQYHLSALSPSTISWIGSTNAFLVFSGGLFFGRLYDRGYFHWLMIGGCSLQTICLFMLSLTQQDQFYQVFLCHGLGLGLAISMSFVPSIAVVSHHFKKRRSIAMSLVTSGTPIGAAVYTVLLNNLFSGNFGFANTIRITAAVNTVLLLTGCALMRTRSFGPKTQVNYSRLLRTTSAPYIFASIGMFLLGAATFFPMFYLQLDSSVHGLGDKFSFYTIVILNAGNFVGRATAGFIAARWGILNTVIGATSSASVVTFTMMTASTRAGLACIGIFFGYFAGVYVALSSPVVALLTRDLSELGARMGILFFMIGLGSLIGAPLAGSLLGSSHDWWKPAVLCGCFSAVSTVMFAIAQLILQREKRAVSVAS